MSIPTPDTATKAPALEDLAKAIVSQIVSLENIERLAKGNENTLVAWSKIVLGILLGGAGAIGAQLADVIVGAEEVADPAFQRLMAVAFKDITGVDLGGAGTIHGGRSSRQASARSLGGALMDAIAGTGGGAGAGGSIEPSAAGAESYVTWVTQMALEGWLTGVLGECVSLGQVEALGDLDDALANTLGLGRMTRRVMGPLLDAKVITPFRWHVNKTYSPELLSPGEVARQVARGRWERERGIEELARQGYSAERIEALLNTARKFFSPSDVRTFVNREYWTRDQGITHLKDQGYDEQGALDALRLEGLRRIDQLEDQQASAIIAAYVDGRITRAQLTGLLNDAITVPSERNLLALLAETRRGLNVRRLSLAQVEAMVKSGVAAMIDYRAAARREGFPEDDVTLLELQLRYEVDKQRTLEQHRAELAAERAAEQERKAAAAAARRLELEAERARQQRGPIGKLERAAVRGLIPLERVREVLAGEYDTDTVGILLDLVEADRADFLERQERAARAETGAQRRGLSLGDLRAALFNQIVTLQEFRQRLLQLGLSNEDAEILTSTAAADLAARLEATQRRGDATTAAAKRRIDLPRFEQLVRRGARTVAQYDGLLADLGFDEPDRAALVDLLELKIADDAAARAERERAAAELAQRGLSLEQFERAVVLGAKSMEEYQIFLADQDFTADAQIALGALLRDRVDEANAARARRRATEGGPGGLTLPLATIRRAARLGVIAPDTYAARLAADGYEPDDIAIDLELLLLEIADVQAARAARDEAERAAAERRLSLADVEQLVKRELAPLEAYRARAAELGYGGDDLEQLVTLLEDELAELQAARARRAQIDAELRTRDLSVAQLEEAVTKGFSSLEAFRDELLRLGYELADAELLTALLETDLGGAEPPAEA